MIILITGAARLQRYCRHQNGWAESHKKSMRRKKQQPQDCGMQQKKN
jgi:hypothetical protein